jgi:hypothetical protein
MAKNRSAFGQVAAGAAPELGTLLNAWLQPSIKGDKTLLNLKGDALKKRIDQYTDDARANGRTFKTPEELDAFQKDLEGYYNVNGVDAINQRGATSMYESFAKMFGANPADDNNKKTFKNIGTGVEALQSIGSIGGRLASAFGGRNSAAAKYGWLLPLVSAIPNTAWNVGATVKGLGAFNKELENVKKMPGYNPADAEELGTRTIASNALDTLTYPLLSAGSSYYLGKNK